MGSYSITASGAADANYTIAYVSGSLAVTAAPLTITADNQNMLYGATLPLLTATYGGFVNGDTSASLSTHPTITTTATSTSPVGSYSITASGAADANYTIAYLPGTLTVSLATMIWNAPANGDWATTNWGSASAYPTLSANAVVDTPYDVTVDASQAANGLTVSNGGQVAIASGGSLTVATDVNVASGGTITVADGGSLATSSLNLADGTLQTQGTFDTSTAVTLEGTDRFDTSGVATLSGSLNNGDSRRAIVQDRLRHVDRLRREPLHGRHDGQRRHVGLFQRKCDAQHRHIERRPRRHAGSGRRSWRGRQRQCGRNRHGARAERGYRDHERGMSFRIGKPFRRSHTRRRRGNHRTAPGRRPGQSPASVPR